MESKWIPVATRLPENYNAVFITCRAASGQYYTEVGRYATGTWRHQSGARIDIAQVIAWMPLPEPCRPEEPEKHEQQWKRSMLNTFLGRR